MFPAIKRNEKPRVQPCIPLLRMSHSRRRPVAYARRRNLLLQGCAEARDARAHAAPHYSQSAPQAGAIEQREPGAGLTNAAWTNRLFAAG